jgi:hypothetical protein
MARLLFSLFLISLLTHMFHLVLNTLFEATKLLVDFSISFKNVLV